MNTFTFDLETIPQPDSELTDIQKEEIEKRVDKALDKDPSLDPHQTKNKIMSVSPYFGKIVTAGVKITQGGKQTVFKAIIGEEYDIIKEFFSLQKHFQGLFITYNGLGFDVPFTLKRAMNYGILPTNESYLITRRFSKYPHFDVKEVISDFDRFAAPTLKLACDLFKIPSPKEGEVKAENVYSAYLEGRIKDIAEYCMLDVEATYQLFVKLQGYYN